MVGICDYKNLVGGIARNALLRIMISLIACYIGIKYNQQLFKEI